MITTRHLQAMAAIAVEEFCLQKGIDHSHIKCLLDHLLSVLTASLLSDWEQQGTQLPYWSGDAVPDDILLQHREKTTQQLQDVVNNATEVGLVDMYGAPTRQPMYFLIQTLGIIRCSGVRTPNFFEFVDACHSGTTTLIGWGGHLSQSEAEAVVSCYRETCRRFREKEVGPV